ncbi:hypothetical protein P691DRAFT_789942 [Macrolepiota fuliginosa MF-IS2]|uniref:NACHT domain-containing protein n=1 Tax=Macrolepiota fuliginosa MF-IS2 TaxID=1400762 RepID=A0A9P5X0D7_9AGAR|nr:hypothetical protein P691DRAFT_789942 [Macrolepiota fuliginosa MF-IS2]
MGFRKRVRNWLKGHLPSPHQPQEQAPTSAHSKDSRPSPAGVHLEPLIIRVVASNGASPAGPWSSSSQGHHSQTGNGSVLSGAHNFTVGQMNAVEAQSIGTQGVGMQNTQTIRADLEHRINGTVRLIWMHGPAGVGKSAIMQTIAETVSTCATLFFSRSSDPPCHDSKMVLTTLAYSLTVENRGYRKYIEDSMFQDPAFLQKSLTEQFHCLFIVPFTSNLVQSGTRRWVVLLDGLDECKNEGNDQCRIVDLISSSILCHAGATPFVWVIASRPEAHLMVVLQKLKKRFRDHSSEFWVCSVPVDSNDAEWDIERYLHAEFTRIREDNSDAFPNSTYTWPLDSNFLKVTNASSGLFVYASTLTKYISADHPASRLKLIVALIDRSTLNSTRLSHNPFSQLNILYTQIMSDIPGDLLLVAKSLLSYFCLICTERRYGKGLVEACNILGLCQDEVYSALHKLHSVLSCPSPGQAEHNGIEFFHASFSDFLFNHSRSLDYHVDLHQELTNTWRCCIRILKESCWGNSTAHAPNHDSVDVHWVPMDDSSRLDGQRRALLHIHPVLFYTNVRLMEQSVDWVNNHRLAARWPRMRPPHTSSTMADVRLYPNRLHKPQPLTVHQTAPKALRETTVFREFPMNELDIECLFKSIYVRPWCCVAADLQCNNVSRWPHMKGKLLGEPFDLEEVVNAVSAKLSGRRTVRVVGMRPWQPYAIIGPFRARFGLRGDAFYVLPYSEAGSEFKSYNM